MMCIRWDIRRPIHFELLKPNEKLNSERCCQQQDNLKTALQEKRSAMFNKMDTMLVYDNARPHAAFGIHQKLSELGWEVLLHPPYCPNLASSDHLFYPLFLSLQDFFTGQKMNKADIRQALIHFFTSMHKACFKNGIYKLPSSCQVLNNDVIRITIELRLTRRCPHRKAEARAQLP
ncbi:histone-lysine N-methyltransferase SETMAR [Trichonephila clavipes]|nr:histone-lysine N-methyltransferase SETMAR [Trichonephila clavipes]